MAKLTMKEAFCLLYLLERDSSTWNVCVAARDAGLNRTRCTYEWADAPFRRLREVGFIARTTGRDRMGRATHTITDARRTYIKENLA